MKKDLEMRPYRTIAVLSAFFFTVCCKSVTEKTTDIALETKTTEQDLSKYETAYFASGCFWCVEAVFESVNGVKDAVSGYSGGTEKNPTYYEVGGGRTSHAEAVMVYYDPKVVNFTTLVTVFFGSHDPTTLNRQGPDKGPQYRSIAFYKNDAEKKIIEGFIKQLTKSKIYTNKIVTEVKEFTKFYEAEAEHQDFEKRNPNNPYVRSVSIPRLNSFKQRFPELLKKSEH